MTLDRSEKAQDFLVARFSRLYPAYWTAILVTSAFLFLANGPVEPPSLRQMAVNFTMVHSFFKVPAVDGVYWTLEVELVFYAMALAVFATGLLRRAHLPILAWLALCAFYYSPFWASHVDGRPFSGLAVRLLILEFTPFFAIGILFYRVYRRQGSPAWNYALVAAAYALVLYRWPASVALMIAAACGVLWMVARGGFAPLRFRPLVFFGTISYSLYLVHQKIGYAILTELASRGWAPMARIALATLVAVALATGITFLVERPAMAAIRKRYKARRNLIRGEGVTPIRNRAVAPAASRR
jgi:peptidoglycan/LPS O-acetylase OafA/YrhL